MTNKEVKDVLQEQIDRYGQEYDAEGIEALNKAIEVLGQQSCDDCISRQAAIDAIAKLHPIDTEYDCTLYDKLDVRYVLKDLPSVTPKADMCDDTISREEAIRVAEQGQIQGYEWQFKKLCNLPPVTPEAKWIPVEEDLPPSYEAVLLYVKYKSSGQWTYQLGMWNENKQAWEDWRTPYQLEEEFEVIAWMELPEGYEEGGHE